MPQSHDITTEVKNTGQEVLTVQDCVRLLSHEVPRSIILAGRLNHAAKKQSDGQILLTMNEHIAQLEIVVRSVGAESMVRFEALQPGQFIQLELCEVMVPSQFMVAGELIQLTVLTSVEACLPFYEGREVKYYYWLHFLQDVRRFFLQQTFIEAQTPTLVECPGTEPSLNPVRTNAEVYSLPAYLPTSPELHLKRLLALGWSRIFEIKNCFRNQEYSDHHRIEFTMLEWYRSYQQLSAIEEDVIALIHFLQQAGWVQRGEDKSISKADATQNKVETVQEAGNSGTAPDGMPKVQKTTISELFQSLLNIKLLPQTTFEELHRQLIGLGFSPPAASHFNDLFHWTWVDLIEPRLDPDILFFVRDFPPSQAAMAELTASGWADRFEVYWQGLELANAFQELRSPLLQQQRFSDDLAERARLGTDFIPLDKDFVQVLQAGMPPAAGIALGVERLFMACLGVKDIKDLRLFERKPI